MVNGDERKCEKWTSELTLQKAQARPPGQTEDQRGNYPVEKTSKNVNVQTSKTPKWCFVFIYSEPILLTLYEKFSKM